MMTLDMAKRRLAWLAILFLMIVIPRLASAQFIQQGGKLVAFSNSPADQGESVALSGDGNTALVGGDSAGCDPVTFRCGGEVWVYTRVNGVWTQQGPGLVGNDATSDSHMGWSVALSADGNTAIVGGPFDDATDPCYEGAAWIFTRTNGIWSQQGSKLDPVTPPCSLSVVYWGWSVALSADGNTAIVGGPGGSGVDNSQPRQDGGAWVFTRLNGVWTQQAKLQDPRGIEGMFLISQGTSVALSADGNTALVGDPYVNVETGAAWVFTRSGGVWTTQGVKLVGAGPGAFQGTTVALSSDGNTALEGGREGYGTWAFTRANGVWSQQGGPFVASGPDGASILGGAVALSADGNTALIGAPADNSAAGSGVVFTRDTSGVWSQLGGRLAGTGSVGPAEQGSSVALSGDGGTAILGGPDDNNGAGAAWIFTRQAAVGAPSPGTASPASGSGPGQSMSFTFNDPRGWQDLDVVNILINNALDGRNACYLAYSRASGVLYLVADNGGTLSQGLALGGSGSVSNSQCTVASAASSAAGSGSTLTLTLNISYTAGFGGNKLVYLAARDLEGGNSGWQALGVWQVPFTPAGTIAVVSLTPARAASASGTPLTFIATLTDAKGTADFGVVNLLANNFIDGRQACYLAYAAASNSLLLVDDAGDAGGPFAGSMTLNGAAAVIQNSQCAVNGVGSSAAKNGNTLVLTLNVTFKSPFAGNRIVWVAGRDAAGANNTDWQAMGTSTVQ